MAILKRPVAATVPGRQPPKVNPQPAAITDRPTDTQMTEIGSKAWEAMASEQRPLSFDDIAAITSLDLVVASEAVKELEEAGFTERLRGGVYIAAVPSAT